MSIFGSIANKSEILLATGTNNSVSKVATYNNGVILTSTLEVEPSLILRFIIEREIGNTFSFKNTNTPTQNLYLSVDENNVAQISETKTFFTLSDFNDTIYSGTQYQIFKDKILVKFNPDTTNIIFLQLFWYELISKYQVGYNICELQFGAGSLLEKLNKNNFRGFTSKSWCETAPFVTNCNEDQTCGECLGRCVENSEVCYPSGDLEFECSTDKRNMNLLPNEKSAITGTLASIAAVIFIYLIVIIFVAGISYIQKRKLEK